MNNSLLDKLTKINYFSFKYLMFIYLFVGIYYFMNSSVGGDEVLFISDIELIKNMGWIEAIRKNISIPYMILSYPFSLFLKNYLFSGEQITKCYKKYIFELKKTPKTCRSGNDLFWLKVKIMYVFFFLVLRLRYFLAM